jgi:DegV family protein with EDD domain
MQYKIVCDSSADPGLFASQCNSVPLKIIAGEKEFIDDSSLTLSEMLTYLQNYKGKSGSACPNVVDFLEAFEGAQYIFCFAITSNLSGSYNAAMIAKEEYESNHPGYKVFVVDSLSAGPEIRLLMEKAQEGMASGAEFDNICRQLEAYMANTGLMFSLESLRNLANNGRVSPIVAKIAGVLGIRLVGRASAQGDLEPMDKCRGEQKALQKIFERMTEQGYCGGKVRIDHCSNPKAADALQAIIHNTFPHADVQTGQCGGLCSFYAEQGGLLVGYEKI